MLAMVSFFVYGLLLLLLLALMFFILIELNPLAVYRLMERIQAETIPAMYRWFTHWLVYRAGVYAFKKHKRRALKRARLEKNFNRKQFEAEMEAKKAHYIREIGITVIRHSEKDDIPNLETHLASYQG